MRSIRQYERASRLGGQFANSVRIVRIVNSSPNCHLNWRSNPRDHNPRNCETRRSVRLGVVAPAAGDTGRPFDRLD